MTENSHRLLGPEPSDAAPSEVVDDDPVAWVADDDPEMLFLLAHYLGARGFRVETFASGDDVADAFASLPETCARAPPDVIVTDVFMPGQSGLDIVAMLRRADWQIPVIMITGGDTSEVRDAAKRFGTVDVLEKPVDMRRLATLASLSV